MSGLKFFLCFVLLSTFTFSQGNLDKEVSGQSKITFTENKGQVHDQNFNPRPDVLFSTTTGDLLVHLRKSGLSYQLCRTDRWKEISGSKFSTTKSAGCIRVPESQSIYRIDLTWLNANKNFGITHDAVLPGCSNFYLPSCVEGALDVKSYTGLTFKNLYSGIDLHYYEKNGQLKHDYLVAPYANYTQIQIKVEGAEVELQNDGSLLFITPLGKVEEAAPIVFQGKKQLVARWVVSGIESSKVLSFEIEDYNPWQALEIDPLTRLWGTYYGGGGTGGSGDDKSNSCATDSVGNVFMAGITGSATSTLIATVGSHQSVNIGGQFTSDGFLVKFNAAGVRQWGTYIGGSGNDLINTCVIDPSGNVIVAGTTYSTTTSNIASIGSHQTTFGGNTDAFLIKFNTLGQRIWGTYYGGWGNEEGNSCATDSNGDIYLCGIASNYQNYIISTPGSHLPLTNAADGFLAKFSASGVRQWGTYYSNPYILSNFSNGFAAYDCCTDPTGNVYMAGTYRGQNTNTAIATPGSHQAAFGGTIVTNGKDAVLVKFSTNGVRQWATYYGSNNNEEGYACATDANGNVYLAGLAVHSATNTGTVIATPACHQFTNNGTEDGFLVKFSPNGVRQWGTFYGGNQIDRIYDCTVDNQNNVYIAGETLSFAGGGTVTGIFIASPGGYQDSLGGLVQGSGLLAADAFLAKFNTNGVRQWGTYYGGSSGELAYGCDVDLYGHAFLCGFTTTNTNTVIASFGSHQSTLSPVTVDGFLVKFDQCSTAPVQPISINGPALVCSGVPASFITPLAYAANFYTLTQPGGGFATSNSNTLTIVPHTSGVYTLVAGNACGTSPQQTLQVTVNPSPTMSINSGAICSGQSFTFVVAGSANYTLSAPQVITPLNTATYTVLGSNLSGCTHAAVSTVIVNQNPTVSVNSGSICTGASFILNPTGAINYTYSSGVPIVSPTVNTTYSVIGQDLNGCLSSNTAIANVSVHPLPVITVNSSHTVLCEGEAVTLTASGALSYTFLPGGTGPSITAMPNLTTTYTITGVDQRGCVNSTIFTQEVVVCLDINSPEERGSAGWLRIYPNPGRGVYYVETDEGAVLSVMNTLGQEVIRLPLNTGKTEFDLSGFSAGIYLVRVSFENGKHEMKLVKE